MSDYAKTTNFATKDALTSGDANKIVKGTELDTEFTNIQTAGATKSNSASPTFTGTVTAAAITVTGAATVIDNNFNITGSSDATKKTRIESDTYVPTGTTVVLTTPAISGTLATTPNDYISGFTLTNNGATGFDVASGYAADSGNAVVVIGSAMSNKTQAAWVAGAAAGGKLHVAAMANNTWYYWYAIWKTVDGTVDYGFDVATTPTFPAGYSKYRYIGARKTQLAATNWDTFIQHGDQVTWSTPPALDLSNAVVSTANRTLLTVNTPALKVEWLGQVHSLATTGTVATLLATDPAVTDVAVSATMVANLADSIISNTTTTTLIVGGPVRCWTNGSSQIGIREQNGTGQHSVQTRGWIDSRGKPF